MNIQQTIHRSVITIQQRWCPLHVHASADEPGLKNNIYRAPISNIAEHEQMCTPLLTAVVSMVDVI